MTTSILSIAAAVIRLLLAGLALVVLVASSTAQSLPQPPTNMAVPPNPPGGYFFQLRHDTLEEREVVLQRMQSDPQRKTPTEVAPLEAQKIDPRAAAQRR